MDLSAQGATIAAPHRNCVADTEECSQVSGVLGTILGMFLAVKVVHDLVSHDCLCAVDSPCALVHSTVGPHQ